MKTFLFSHIYNGKSPVEVQSGERVRRDLPTSKLPTIKARFVPTAIYQFASNLPTERGGRSDYYNSHDQ